MKIKKMKIFLVFSIIMMLVLPTAQIEAVDINEENITNVASTNESRNNALVVVGDIIYECHISTRTATVIGHTGDTKVIHIPPTINRSGDVYTVTAIGNSAFQSGTIQGVTLPSTLITIGDSAFDNNQITSVTIPNSVTSIGNYAFCNNRLISVTIPNSVTSIGNNAFMFNQLTSAIIPNSVTSIGNEAFSHNQITTVTIPNSVTSIGVGTFMLNHLTSVEIPNSVTSIGMSAFRQNRLTSVTIPNSVTSIGNLAFFNNRLTSLTIPNSVTSIGEWAFRINNLTSVTIPNSVTSIGNAAFSLNPLQYIHTDDGNADNLKSMLTNMGDIGVDSTMLLEQSPIRYESGVEIVNNVFTGSDLELRTISQIKYVYNNHSRTWSAYVPVVQWYRNGSPITGATNATLTLSNIQASDAGGYHAVVDSTVLENITVNVTVVYPISELFPDANLAKAIAQELHGNENTNIQVTLEELASITNLNLDGKGIENLKGVEHLVNVLILNLDNNKIQDITPLTTLNRLQSLLLRNNHINNIKPLSTLDTLYDARNQTISLPDVILGESTNLQLINRDGSTPSVIFDKGEGTYENEKLTWTTDGENQLSWQGGSFSGTVTQTVKYKGFPISNFFPDENLAKAIAQALHSNTDTGALTTEIELATISSLNIPNLGIKDLTGLDYLTNLNFINASGNHISDIRILSKLAHIAMYDFASQTVLLPDGVRGEPTDLQLVNRDGSTPAITFVQGQGTYENGKLTWTTGGENQFTWQEGSFSGTVTQTVIETGLPISDVFPDENLAKAIAQELHGNENTNIQVTLEELASIINLNLDGKGIENLKGVEHLVNVLILNLDNNKIQDITPLTTLNKLQSLLLRNNHISNIKPLSTLDTLYDARNQTISLPDTILGEPTDIPLVDRDGSTPSVTFDKGQGTYENGKLTWTTDGENQLSWQGGTQFSGVVTQNVNYIGLPIRNFFPDENLAKAIAQALHSNTDIGALTTETELATITYLNIPNLGIKDLTGLDYLTNLNFINAPGNHISDIRILSKLAHIAMYDFASQTVLLPDGVRGEPTDLQLVNRDGSTPAITFVQGQGTYENGKLTWTTGGENQFTWQEGNFSGTVTQTVIETGVPISDLFPDENLAKAIAQELHGNENTNIQVSSNELASISNLNLDGKGIENLKGVEHLVNVLILNLNNNKIQDITPLTTLNKLQSLLLRNNHISNIKPLSTLDTLYDARNQTISLPDAILGESTDIPLVDRDGSTPSVIFDKGQGTYENGKLTWTTDGENQLSWQGGTQFSGRVTQNVNYIGFPIRNFFPDENLAKAIAQALHSNTDTGALTTETELATISSLNIPNLGIKDLTGLDYLTNLNFINASGNHISDIRILSKLAHIAMYDFASQTVLLPDGVRGEPTDLQLVNRDGSTPTTTFVQGQGTYENGKLTWTTGGENQFTWQEGNFSGTVTQTVIDTGLPISELFPDENLAKAIAQQLYGNENTNIHVSSDELASITNLNLDGKGIENLKGVEHLVNVLILNLDNNKIQDITPLTTLNKLQSLLLRNNHISNIKPLSTLDTLYDARNQTISLPNAILGESTDIPLVDRDGSTPSVTFDKGQGTYENGKLTWTTEGDNQLSWQGGSFSGTVTQNVKYKGFPIRHFFPDENLAKGIAQALHSNTNINALTTETELAKISSLHIPNLGIKDLTGLDYLINLAVINAPGNHISDIRILSKLPHIVMYSFVNQTISLPDGVRGEPTDLQLANRDGSTPTITFVQGQGTYENGKLTWTTGGENQLTWQESIYFSGTATQNVKDKGLPISHFFPDQNLAKEIALILNKNEDSSAITTEEDLAKIDRLFIPQKGIKDLTGLDHLKNLSIISANGNHIHDISIVSKLPHIVMYSFLNQTIPLPEGVRDQPTDIALVNINGTTPSISYVKGEGTYVDGKLTWSSVGENQLTWQAHQFSGTLTQTTIPPMPPAGQPIASLFPDENLAKEIAQVLHGNQDTSVYVTEEQLLDITLLSISKKGIKNLSGIENLKHLIGLDISQNHIHDISMLSDLPNLILFMANEQTITLPEVTLGTPTKLTIRNEKGVTPNHTFTVGQGTYVGGEELRWTTAGENQLTWSSSSLMGEFNGKVIQNVVQPKQTIASMFPDTNFAQSIAIELHGNTDTSAEVTEQDLARITQLTISHRNIRSISGIDNLHNLVFLSAEGNQITDISMLSKLPKLVTFYIAKQSVILSDVVTGTPTPLTLLNHNGIVPQYEFTVGKGSYNNGMLTWTRAGENKLTWTYSSQSDGFFDGTIIQNVF